MTTETAAAPVTRKIGVYGTLRRGHGLHRYLSECECLKVTSIKGTMYSLGGCPGVKFEGEDDIIIEIYAVEEGPLLDRLDKIEGHPDWYRREVVATTCGEPDVEVYHYLPSCTGFERITSGDWDDYTRRPDYGWSTRQRG